MNFKILLGLLGIALSTSILATENIELNSNWKFKQANTNEWLPASVPGCVHTDLLDNKRIEDPFFRTNETNLQWIGYSDWEYINSFEVSSETLKKENIDLVFEGLDTYADVFLNNNLVLSADNMHRTWKIDAKKFLKAGKNELRIYFHSAINKGKELLAKSEIPLFQFPNNDQADTMVSIFMRKAGYHFGWDWGPRFVTAGIWKKVYLQTWDKFKIDGVQITTDKIENKKAYLTANFDVLSSNENNAELNLLVNNKAVLSHKVLLKKGLNKYSLKFQIDNPNLWWSNGLGKANLYDINAKITAGNTSDLQTFKYGIRTIEVVAEKDSIGKSLYIKLNGIPVFMKGANYIPSENFTNRFSDSAYEYTIKSAADAHMNMLRVWGGGYFEKDVFYDLCDKYGILIWHDMLFACGTYPGTEDYFNSVTSEIKDNVKRIRNHASIALWNGNNEVEVAYNNWGWKEKLSKTDQAKQEANTHKLFYEIIPAAIFSEDSTRYYHPTSPNTGFLNIPMTNGDVHYWSVWHGKEPFESYNTNVGRFMSEYGFQSYPEFNSVKKFTALEDWTLDSKVMQAHQRCMADDRKDMGYGNRLIKHYMDQYYKEPKSFEDYLYVSQLLQAKGVKIAVEAHRRNMPLCMGTLYWQINDCWPVASWSSIDYYGQWKALHYLTQRELYKEQLISVIFENGKYNVHIISDRLDPLNADLEIELIDFSGKHIKSFKKNVAIPANTSTKVFSIDNAELTAIDKTNNFLKIALKSKNQILASTNFYFVPEKEMKFSKPEIQVSFSNDKNETVIKLKSNVLVKDLFLSNKENNGFFSDNFFDLIPGEEKTIRFKPYKQVDLKNEIVLKSLFDTL